MSDNAPESSIVIDEVTVRTFAPRAPRTNLDGEELERFIPHMNRITRVYRKSRAVKLTLDFVEQLEMPTAASDRSARNVPRGGQERTRQAERRQRHHAHPAHGAHGRQVPG